MGLKDTFRILQTINQSLAQPLLSAALVEPYENIQEMAINAIDAKNKAGITAILKNFHFFNSRTQKLFQNMDQALLPEIKALLESGDDSLRINALNAVAALGNAENASLTVPLLGSPSKAVSDTAVKTLKTLAASLSELFEEYKESDTEALKCLYSSKSNAFINALSNGMRTFSSHKREELLEILINTGPAGEKIITGILAGSNAQLRDALVRILRAASTTETFATLMRLLSEHDPAVVNIAREIMLSRKGKVLGRMLTNYFIKTPEKDLFSLAGRMEELPWWGTLKEILTEMDDEFAIKAVNFMENTRINDVEKIEKYEELMQLMSPAAKVLALEKLNPYKHPLAKQVIINTLQDKNEIVQLKAAEFVIAMVMPEKNRLLTPLINSPFQSVRKFVSRELSRDSFDKYLHSFDKLDERTKELAGKAIAKIDLSMAEKLSEELQSLDPDRRIKALQIIEIADKSKELEPFLLELINDPDRKVRATVIKAISLLGSVNAIKLLIKTLGDPDRRTRANAVEAFEDIGNKKLGTLLMPFLKDPDNRVRANAAKALWNLGYSETKDVLEEMLCDPVENMRLSAVWALGEINYPGVRIVLKKVAEEDQSPLVRNKALKTLEELK
ncbi:MAG: HEAT repeat domain-containing protein [Planctomycetes bacterium]|nr:HEAT repeat domain-containing protein [Planctomycetota bacterium]